MKYWLMKVESKARVHDRAQRRGDWDSCVRATAGPDAKAGDAVLLWRGGRGGGVVAIAQVLATAAVVDSRTVWMDWARREDDDGSAPTHVTATLEFSRLMLATPLSADELRKAGLDPVTRCARSARAESKLVALEFTDEQYQVLLRLADQAMPPSDWPATWNIPAGTVVKRVELHDVYGGNPRLRVCSSAKTPNAFLILKIDATGELAPRWDGPVLFAPGHGQWWGGPGLENLAVLGHLHSGLPLRVFAGHGSECLYLGEFVVAEEPVVGWVVSGTRRLRYDPNRIRDVRTPIFRLRQLNGVPSSCCSLEDIQNAPRISLKLHPSSDQPAAATIRRLLTVLEQDPAVAESIGRLEEAQLLAALVQHTRRQSDLDELRSVVEDQTSQESDLQKLIQRMTWIFGGEFLPGTARRTLTLRDQLDLALLRPDGTLHGVELKRARIRPLVSRHRNHLIVGNKVNEAVGQAANYLRELDEKRPQILADLGIDCRRASMTVVIGHSAFASTQVGAQEVNETIRTFNSHLSRIQVTTYDQLIENAQRTLDLALPAT